MKKRISVGDKSVCFGLPVLKGQCPRWASPPLFPQGWLNWLHFFKEWTQSLNEQINYKWFKNKPKNLICSNEIKGFKKITVAWSPGLAGWPQRWEMEWAPGKGACADPLCHWGLCSIFWHPTTNGTGSEDAFWMQIARSRSPISFPLWANILNHLTWQELHLIAFKKATILSWHWEASWIKLTFSFLVLEWNMLCVQSN